MIQIYIIFSFHILYTSAENRDRHVNVLRVGD